MRILVLHNETGDDASLDERDVIVQREAITAALNELGHETQPLGCTLDLRAIQQCLQTRRPDIVFNLVESLGGTDRLACLATLLMEAIRVPYTGATTEMILATSNKPAAKQRMRAAGLPTPDWIAQPGSEIATRGPRRFILKPVWEHASVGMDDDAVVEADVRDVAQRLRERAQASGHEHFAEQFIEGREFNFSLLAGLDGPQPLPAAEIDFSAFPANKPRIVGYRAKWDEQSTEYHQTPRTFDFHATDRPLLDRLAHLACRCWELFELRGYARVDFRVDQAGQPWILEVNTNPCLSPDAGFAAALQRAGIGYTDAIQRILDEAR